MSKMNIEIFDRETDLVSFTNNGERGLVIELSEEVDGYVSIGKSTSRIKGRQCAIDTRGLSDGEYLPHLILADRTLDLPKISLTCGIITPTEPEVSYISRLSVRERKLAARVEKLEKRLDEITKKIVGNGIFNTAP